MQKESIYPKASDLYNSCQQLQNDIRIHYLYLLELGVFPNDNPILRPTRPIIRISEQDDEWSKELTRRHNAMTTIFNKNQNLAREIDQMFLN